MIGIDLVFVPEFQRLVENGGDHHLRKAFGELELPGWSVQHLAGVSAANETVANASLVASRRLSETKITHDVSRRRHGRVQDRDPAIPMSHHE